MIPMPERCGWRGSRERGRTFPLPHGGRGNVRPLSRLPRHPHLSGMGIINVRDYGATGNGHTDDSAAVQHAIDIATDLAGPRVEKQVQANGVVYFPQGTYLLNHPLEYAGAPWRG